MRGEGYGSITPPDPPRRRPPPAADGAGGTGRDRDRRWDVALGALLGAVAAALIASLAGGYAGEARPPRGSDSDGLGRAWSRSAAAAEGAPTGTGPVVSLGPRPYFLMSQMSDGDPLKDVLSGCADTLDASDFRASDFVIGHRGASLQFPEHTVRSHDAASRMGAGIVECDVTFTADRQLVCRHSQCDLHRTTDVLLRPEMAARCSAPFSPADGATGRRATAECCTTDFTLAEIQSLCGKMDAEVATARTPEEFVGGTPSFRTDLYSHDCPRIPSHREYIANVMRNGGRFTPELKVPLVDMPFEGDYTLEMFAQQIIDEYIEAGIDPVDVYPQSFLWEVVQYWLDHTGFGEQALALDDAYGAVDYSERELREHFRPLLEAGARILAPPMFLLLEVGHSPNGTAIEPSLYARVAKEMGLDIITWTLERSDSLAGGGGFYYQTIADAVSKDANMLNVLHMLTQQVGIIGIFTDWAATVTFYANCMGLKLR